MIMGSHGCEDFGEISRGIEPMITGGFNGNFMGKCLI